MVELDCTGQEIPFGREGGIHLTRGPHGWKTELENRNRRGGRGSADGGTPPPGEADGQEPPPVARALPVAVPAVISRLR